jgi:hypothetical protein
MIAQRISFIEVRKLSLKDKISCALMPIALVTAIIAIGAAIPAIFWGIWYAFSGYIPTFWGYSRLWLDTFSGAFYIIVVGAYVLAVLDSCDNLSHDGKYKISLREFITKCPWLSLLGIFLAINLIASIFLSLATGLAAILVLVGFIHVGPILGKLLLKFIDSAAAYEDDDI